MRSAAFRSVRRGAPAESQAPPRSAARPATASARRRGRCTGGILGEARLTSPRGEAQTRRVARKSVSIGQFVDTLKGFESAPVTSGKVLDYCLENAVDRASLKP